MCSRHLVEPAACTPASGWEKGQVENQVGVVRERFFSPRLRVANFEALNARLLDRCVAYARARCKPKEIACRDAASHLFTTEQRPLVGGEHDVAATRRMRALLDDPA